MVFTVDQSLYSRISPSLHRFILNPLKTTNSLKPVSVIWVITIWPLIVIHSVIVIGFVLGCYELALSWWPSPNNRLFDPSVVGDHICTPELRILGQDHDEASPMNYLVESSFEVPKSILGQKVLELVASIHQGIHKAESICKDSGKKASRAGDGNLKSDPCSEPLSKEKMKRTSLSSGNGSEIGISSIPADGCSKDDHHQHPFKGKKDKAIKDGILKQVWSSVASDREIQVRDFEAPSKLKNVMGNPSSGLRCSHKSGSLFIALCLDFHGRILLS